MPTATTVARDEAPRHRWHDDLQALATGSLLGALGIVLLQHAGLLPGGSVGLALLLHYASGIDIGLAIPLAAAPFYALALLRMPRPFVAKTLAAVLLTSAFTQVLPRGLALAHVSPLAGAALGGLLLGVSLLVLFRHQASLGGLGVLVLYLQRRFGWRAGWVQMGLDAVIVLAGGALSGRAQNLAWSALAVLVLNLVLAVNDRPGRYRALQ